MNGNLGILGLLRVKRRRRKKFMYRKIRRKLTTMAALKVKTCWNLMVQRGIEKTESEFEGEGDEGQSWNSGSVEGEEEKKEEVHVQENQKEIDNNGSFEGENLLEFDGTERVDALFTGKSEFELSPKR
uniref:Uncharacterized protein n=1 Tax=Solanum tuberosum TaxID=4113 RepID=M0ZGD9_SOLTU